VAEKDIIAVSHQINCEVPAKTVGANMIFPLEEAEMESLDFFILIVRIGI
jgi:hypothetical protein